MAYAKWSVAERRDDRTPVAPSPKLVVTPYAPRTIRALRPAPEPEPMPALEPERELELEPLPNPADDAALLGRLRKIGTSSPEIRRIFELAAYAIATSAARNGWQDECDWLRRHRLHIAADEIEHCRQRIKDLEEAAGQTAAPTSMEAAWREMATAPRDGTRIELYRPKNGPVFGRWDDNAHATRPQPYWTNDQERVWGTQAVRADQPTHWRPISTPPTITARTRR